MAGFSHERLHHIGVVLAGASAVLMVNLDTTVVTIILPDIARIFNTSADTIALVNVSYLLALTAFLPVFGKLSDRIGVERVFTPAYLLFALFSLLCGLAPGVNSLFLARFFQGIAGAMLMATSAVVVVKYIPEEKRGSVFGINGLMAGMGFALGAPLGGWLSTLLSWRWVFFLNIPLGLIGFYLCTRCLRRKEAPRNLSGLDYQGAILAILALASMIITLSTAQLFHAFGVKLLAGISAVIFLFLFIRQEQRTDDPLLKLSLLRCRPFTSSLLANFTYLFFLYGLTFMLPFFFMYVRQTSTIDTSHYLVVFPVIAMLIMPVAGRLCDAMGTRGPALLGMAMFAVSGILISLFNADSSAIYIVCSFCLLGAGMAFFGTAILTMTMTHATPENMGMVSALKAFFPIFGGLLGVTVFASIFSHAIEKGGMAVEHTPPALVAASFSSSMYMATGVTVVGLLFTLLSGPKNK